MSGDNVVGLNGKAIELGEDQVLVDAFKAGLRQLRSNGGEPTAALWVAVCDDGQFRFGWNSEQSALPGSAVVGIAVAAIMKIGQSNCE